MNATPGSDPNTIPIVITREFDAPRNLVFKALTEPDRLACWWGPRGTSATSVAMDLRPGGSYHYGMGRPGGEVMWGLWIFREIVEPERLVFVNTLSDEAGESIRHPAMPGWPELLTVMTLSERDGRTTLTVEFGPLPDASDAERATFAGGSGGASQGWAGALDKLEAHLAEAVATGR